MLKVLPDENGDWKVVYDPGAGAATLASDIIDAPGKLEKFVGWRVPDCPKATWGEMLDGHDAEGVVD